MDYYNTIETSSAAEFKDRGSKFIAYSFPLLHANQLKTHLQLLKKEHQKAVHFCFAYRLGIDKNNFRTNDNGEPSGTAGQPILGQIDARALTNCLVIVVRYFGGTLLGVPGLINAYKTVASLVLQCTPIIRTAIEKKYQLQFNYTEMNEVMRLIKLYNCTIYKNEMQLFCVIETGIPQTNSMKVLAALQEIKHLEIHLLK